MADNRSAVGLAAGGSRQDNTYLIDGANITSPAFGTLAIEVNELDIAEVNLKRAGVTAEFGRTRRHRDQRREPERLEPVRGSGPHRLAARGAGERATSCRPICTAAGLQPGDVPRSAADARRSSRRSASAARWSATCSSSTGPPATSGTQVGPRQQGRRRRCRTKCARAPSTSASSRPAPSSSHQLTFSHRDHPLDADNNGLTSDYAPSVATTSDHSSRITTLDWAYFPSPHRSLNVRYQRTREINEDVPVTRSGYLPPFDPAHLAAMGQYTDPLQANLITGGREFTNMQNYRRHEVRGDGQAVLRPRPHQPRAQGRRRLRVRRGDAQPPRQRLGHRSRRSPSAACPALRARYFTPQPPQLGQGDTYSLFVQDALTLSNRLSVNAGVLLNRDEFAQRARRQRRLPRHGHAEGRRGGLRVEGRHLHLPALRLRRRDPAAPRRQLSAARAARATRSTATGAATTTWTRNRAAAAWRRAASSRPRRSST